jgi:hypothetical protein
MLPEVIYNFFVILGVNTTGNIAGGVGLEGD